MATNQEKLDALRTYHASTHTRLNKANAALAALKDLATPIRLKGGRDNKYEGKLSSPLTFFQWAPHERERQNEKLALLIEEVQATNDKLDRLLAVLEPAEEPAPEDPAADDPAAEEQPETPAPEEPAAEE